MKIALGSDHHGVEFKKRTIARLTQLGHEAIDLGTQQSDEPCDYPDHASQVGRAVSQGQAERGILICGSGVGMAIVANKFLGVRAAVCDSVEIARLTRRHNNVNVLCLSGTVWKQQDLLPVVEAFLETEFEGGRHQRRIDKIHEIEMSLR